LRALVSALAGGGLTAAGLGGPLAGGALGATGQNANGQNADGSSAASTEPGAGATQAETGQTTTTTTTTETSTAPTQTTTAPTTTAPSTTPTETTSAPAAAPSATTPSSPTTTAPSASAPQPRGSAPASTEAPTVVLKKRKQKPTASSVPSKKRTSTAPKAAVRKPAKRSKKKASGPNNVARSPQEVALEARALAAILASTEASDQALAFYRIPLFLLPIYKAAAVQYGVPWQILAAINEIETDYGNDLSVSSAGAVGWMQFMPSTWLQYGVDALNAGYADPYNPVDAIFAAARYLRAAGAATDLRAAILAYNHSEEYVESVLLRAKLIASYPKAVIATLTGLVDGRLPVTGAHVAWSPVPSASSATAGATPLAQRPAAPASAAASDGAAGSAASTPGSSAAVSPAAAAAAASSHAASTAAQALQLVELMSSPNASVVAVQDGRIVKIGDSRKLGKYIVLRDVYGDVFTYAGIGSIAPSYALPKQPGTRATSPAVEAASTRAPAPSQAASAGSQPVTLKVTTPARPSAAARGEASIPGEAQEAVPAGMDRARLFAHPGNPDARAALAAVAKRRARRNDAGQRVPLRAGSVVATGTVLGRVSVPAGARDGHLRFAVAPAGDSQSINPGPVLSNWAQLQKALHPQGARATDALLGATASDVFLLSKAQLERAVLSDPGIALATCVRHEVAAGLVDRRLLAVLAFLSRSGLTPTVGSMSCGARQYTPAGAPLPSDDLDITAINGTAIAGHQGTGTITELTIRTLLSLPHQFVPAKIVSLMRFPGAANTQAAAAYWDRLHLEFERPAATASVSASATATAAHSAGAGKTAPAPVVTTSALSAAQWNQLMVRVSALPAPSLAAKPSSAAIPDPKRG